MTKKQEKPHEHIWLTGRVAFIQDPSGDDWVAMEWVAYPKTDDDANSCHDEVKVTPAKQT